MTLLAPEDPGAAEPRGLLTASDGSAWLVVTASGTWRPGYAHVQRLRAPP
jgi:hypothetical protein